MKCSVKDCNVDLYFEISRMTEICRWCRKELEPDWDDWEWQRDCEMEEFLFFRQ